MGNVPPTTSHPNSNTSTTGNKILKLILLNNSSSNSIHLNVNQTSAFTPITPSFTPPNPLEQFPSIKPTNSITTTKLTQRVIPDRFAELAANFWQNNVECCSMKHRLELACSIFFGMMATSIDIHRLTADKLKTNNELENAACRNVEMIGFVIRNIYANNANLPVLLNKLGTLHNNMGIKPEYYNIMLDQLNQTLHYYYPATYTPQVAFAITEVFTYTAQLMCGSDIIISTERNDMSFLHSLRSCISHKIGREYLYRYLNNMYCEEMVVFLHLLSIYKSTKRPEKRYLLSKNICKTCIVSNGIFAVNICYELRQRILSAMCTMEKDTMNIDFFVDVEDEICRLIMQSHWKKFQTQVNELYDID